LFPDQSLLTGVNDSRLDLKDLEKALDHMITKTGVVVLWCNIDLLFRLRQNFNKFCFKYNYVVNKSLSVPKGKYYPIPTVEYIGVFFRTKTKISETVFNSYKSGITKSPYKKANYQKYQKTRKKIKPDVDINKNGDRFIRSDLYMKARPNLSDKERKAGGGHPFQKELKLTRILTRVYTNKKSLIVDGFMGSGTQAEACIKENRRFIGFEIDKKWYRVAKNRVNKATSQVEIFNQ
jgi:DNA modification methylase